jgi:hypothetical protein
MTAFERKGAHKRIVLAKRRRQRAEIDVAIVRGHMNKRDGVVDNTAADLPIAGG